ncbi:TolB family protein [Nocardioides marmotae]|uniref:TolB family protein n=1 Tax=Nocardioides marmotae TaxID=2663857 RepID=UPI001E2B45AF|nr:hypothetical protein [Nocardioides marmotae]
MRARAGWPLAAGAVAAVLAFLVSPLPAGGAPGVAGPAALPDRLAGYSWLTGDVSDSAPGRAVALLQHGYGVEFMDWPQAVVVGWRGDSYRRVGEAEDRAGGETQGDPAPMLLSPDGRMVAVGDHRADDPDAPDLAVVDLRTGGTTYRPLPAGGSIRPLAWSADSRLIAYLVSGPTNPYSRPGQGGDLLVLDLATGRATPVPGAEDVVRAAFDPTGSRLAVQHTRASGGGLAVVDTRDGSTRRISRAALPGPAAWSPNGRLLAVLRGGGSTPTVSFLDPRTGALVGDPVTVAPAVPGSTLVLGWTGPDKVVAFVPGPAGAASAADDEDREAGEDDSVWLGVVPLDGGEPRTLTELGDLDSFGVATWQLAQDALPGLEIRSAPGADRGPWPWPWRAALAGVIGALAAWGTTRVTRHDRIRRWRNCTSSPGRWTPASRPWRSRPTTTTPHAAGRAGSSPPTTGPARPASPAGSG